MHVSPPAEHPDASTADEKRGSTEVREGQGFNNNNALSPYIVRLLSCSQTQRTLQYLVKISL